MSGVHLIGLCGRAGAGKTTVAEHLASEWSFDHFAFADPLRAMLAALFDDAGVPDAFLTERFLKEQPTTLGFSYRHLIQTLGTEWGRSLAPDFWLRIAEAKLQEARRQGAHVVISDVRFQNEARWLRERGGVLVCVLRDDTGEQARDHVSERAWGHMDPDHVLINEASRAALYDQVDVLIHRLRQATPMCERGF